MDGGLMAKTKDKPSKKDDKDFLSEAMKRYERGYERERENMDLAYEDLEFRAGDQWDAIAEKCRREESRPVLTVNQIPQYVRQVTGDMRMSRPGIKVVPVDSRGDKETGEILAGMIRYIETRSDAQYAYMVGGDSQVTAGIGHWQVVTEYAEESTFNQELRIMAVEDGVSVVWDPDSMLPTREDAAYCFVPVDMTRAAFEERYPDKVPSDIGLSHSTAYSNWVTADTIRVARYWEKRIEKRLLALNPDGSIDDLTDKGPEEIQAAQAKGARVEKRDGACIYHSLICAGEVLEEPKKWPGRYIPIIPVLGEEVRIGKKLFRHGLVRFAKDPQRMYNYYCSAQTEVVALQPKAPWLVTETMVEENEGMWETANSRNYPFLVYKPDKAAPTLKPERMQPAVSSQGINEGMMRAGEDLQRVTGIYLSSLGAQSNETSGKAINARDRQADVGTFVYLDNFARAIRHTGRILIDLVPHIYDTERMIRVVGEDGKVDLVEINKTVQQPILEGEEQPHVLHDVTIGAYDVVLDAGPSYTTKREEAKEGMIEFLRTNPDAGPLIVDLVAKAQDWPLADEIAERLETVLPQPIMQKVMAKKSPEEQAQSQPPPPSPEEQAKAQLEMRDAEAEVSKKEQEAKKLMLENAEKEFQMKVQAAQMAGAIPMPQPEPQEPDPQIAQALQQIAQMVQQQSQAIEQMAGALQVIMQPPMPAAPPMQPQYDMQTSMAQPDPYQMQAPEQGF
jgi:hypothetical protein